MRDSYAKRNEIGTGNPANWLVNGRKPVQPVLWSTNAAWYLYSFWALFVLYEVQLDNKAEIIRKVNTMTHLINSNKDFDWVKTPYLFYFSSV